MVLYLDTKFLDDFFLEYRFEKETRLGFIKFDEIISRFTGLTVHINLKDQVELDDYKNSNPLIEKFEDYGAQFIFTSNLKKNIENYELSIPALAFVGDSNDWCSSVSSANLIVSNIESFASKLESLLDIKREFDLIVKDESEEDSWKGWQELGYLSKYTNEIIITDNYMLKE